MSLLSIPNSSLWIFLLHRWKTLRCLLSPIKIRFPTSMTHFPLTVTAVQGGSREGFPGWSFPGEAVVQWNAWLPEWQGEMQHQLRFFLRNKAHKSGKRTSALPFQHIWAETPPPSVTDHLTISYLIFLSLFPSLVKWCLSLSMLMTPWDDGHKGSIWLLCPGCFVLSGGCRKLVTSTGSGLVKVVICCSWVVCVWTRNPTCQRQFPPW